MAETALPAGKSFPQSEKGREAETAGETTPGKDRAVRWKTVTTTQGAAEAAIVQGRLESEGIPARVQQEPAGAVIGLTVGLLGEAKVLVPEPLVERALRLLNEPLQEDVEDEE